VKKLALPIAVGLVLAGIVHLVSVLIMPNFAERDAYSRLSVIGSTNTVAQMDDPTPFGAVLPATDPAFVTAICLYDLGEGPLRLRVPTSGDYTSVSFYTKRGMAFYAINDRSAGRRVIELDLMNAKQKAALPDDEEVTAADRLIVVAPENEGIVLMRALSRERGARDEVKRRMDAATCGAAS
jgi:uncharacterized membrane protein